MSLTSCLKKAADHIDPSDKSQILLRSRELRAEGKSADEAGRAAIDEQLSNVRDMITEAEAAAAPPATAVSFARAPAPDTPEFKNWFRNSTVVNADGTPKVMYHGTAQDIQAFRAKQANAIFVTDDPSFAEGFSEASAGYLAEHQFKLMSRDQMDAVVGAVRQRLEREYGDDPGMLMTQLGHLAGLQEAMDNGSKPWGELGDYLYEAADLIAPSAQNIIPLYVRAENPFDYENPAHVAAAVEASGDYANRDLVADGRWDQIEREVFQAAIKKLGHDSFYVKEAGRKNLAVYNSSQLKSVTGNNGQFSEDPRISFARITETPAFKAWFGDSKVVDAEGKPLVVYHGTKADIDAFKPSRGGEYGSGIYLTPDAGAAWGYAERKGVDGSGGETLMPLFVAIKNPLITTDRQYARALGVRALKARGYDGIIGVGPTGERQYIAFDPGQIKSAIGNNGDFNAADPRISFAREHASWSSERIDGLLEDHAYLNDDDKSKAWATWVSPRDFLAATIPAGHEAAFEAEKEPLDREKIAGTRIPITLNVVEKDGVFYLVGHEGRHRMMALRDEGVDRVPVVVRPSLGGTNLQERSGVFVTAQDWGNGLKASKGFFLGKMTPINWTNAGKLRKEFGREDAAVSFARNATKHDDVQGMLDFAQDGKIRYELPDAVERGQWADAFLAAKDPAQRKGLLAKLGDATIRAFADSRIDLQRWIEKLPLGEPMKQRLLGDLRRSDAMRSAMEQDVKDHYTEPMMRAVTKAAKASGLSTDAIKKVAGGWMTAMYAPEANAWLIRKDRAALVVAQNSGDARAIHKAQANLAERIADVNGAIGAAKTRGVGGGLNDAEAAEAVRRFEKLVDRQLLEEVAKPIYDMLADNVQRDLRNGRVTQAMVNSWLKSPRYVPLTGDPHFNSEDSGDVFSTGGGQINQDADREMGGRRNSLADDGIDAAFAAAIRSINFAAIQDFKRTLNQAYEAAAAAGQDIGLKRERITGVMRTGDDVVMYRESTVSPNGAQQLSSWAFRFDDGGIVAALKKDNVESVNAVLRLIQHPTRWYARAVTQFVPMFAPLNMLRDIWERSELLRTRKLVTTAGQQIDTKAAARASILGMLDPQLWRASIMHAIKRGGMNPVRGDLEELIRLGGISTVGGYLDRSAQQIEKSMRGEGGKVKHRLNQIKHVVEAWNDVFEMMPSLAIYRSLKAQGMAAKDATAATLDLMNFHKKGTIMGPAKALYMFAQPVAISGHNMAQYLSTPTGRIRFATQLLIGMGLYALLRGAWGDEDDEELGNKLDNIGNFVIERTVPVPIGDHMVKVPVGFGPPQLAWMMAGSLDRFISGRYTAPEAAGEMAKGWVKTFAPVSPSDMEVSKRPLDWAAQTFTPSILRPLLNIVTNQNAFGLPLTPYENKDKPRREQALRTTPKEYAQMAEALHDMLGVDVFPDHIKALADGYMVGPLREVVAAGLENPAREMRGEPGRVPLVSQVVDTVNDRSRLNSIYARARAELEQNHREVESMQTDVFKRGSITPEMREMDRAWQRFAAVEQDIGLQRSSLKKISDRLDPDTLAERAQRIEARADDARRRLLARYMESKAAR
jgi:hypothetical protein